MLSISVLHDFHSNYRLDNRLCFLVTVEPKVNITMVTRINDVRYLKWCQLFFPIKKMYRLWILLFVEYVSYLFDVKMANTYLEVRHNNTEESVLYL